LGFIEINLIDYVSATTSNISIHNNVVLEFKNENKKFIKNIKFSIITRSLLTRTPLSATTKLEEEQPMELNAEAEEKFSQNQIELHHQKFLYNYFVKEISRLTSNMKIIRKTQNKGEGSEDSSDSVIDENDKLKEALTKSEDNYKILKKEYDLFKKRT